MNYLFVIPKNVAKSPGGYNIFPVGITYVTAFLKKKGINVFTSNLEYVEGDTFSALNHLIKENGIDLIATTGLSRDYGKVREVVDVSRKIKPGIITLVGGGIISGDPQSAMKALDADIGVIGEGELTMYNLAVALNNNESYKEIPGVIYRDTNNEYQITSLRPEIIDIHEIEIPDYDGFNFTEHMRATDYRGAYVVASRSCPFNCTFCFHPSGTKYRQRDMDHLFHEIDYLTKTYSVRSLGLTDELFAFKKERILEFCTRMQSYNLPWGVQLRVSDVDDNMLKKMKNAGCVSISYGIESADNSILKSMKKHITVEQTDFALNITYENDIDIQGGLIFGDVAETMQSVERSLKWWNANRRYALELNMIQVFPGSGLYKYAIDNKVISDPVQYLKEGCPLINVSKLTDQEYKDLSSKLYEINMRSKYPPERIDFRRSEDHDHAVVDLACNKCGATSRLITDFMHIVKYKCNTCNQRHYVDPFEKITCPPDLISSTFPKEEDIAVWGAGEICIKLLDNYPELQKEHFHIVDISRSRQGYSICGKQINSPDIISTLSIKKVIIAILRRKSEVIREIESCFPDVEMYYLPIAETDNDDLFLNFSETLLIGDTRPACQVS